ncbi:hypothetical protein, partial [Turicimonas muris]|uniref:hypothetical protein n=1 Tax=Turicimonas muris TaxID=1796652 RepID=UPI0026E0C202
TAGSYAVSIVQTYILQLKRLNSDRGVLFTLVSIVQTYILQLKQAHPGPDSAPLVGFNCTNLHPSTETWIA